MANSHNLFIEFNDEIKINSSKKYRMITSRDNLRDKIRTYFNANHPKYHPAFFIQGSYKMGTSIRTTDDTCDLDDGVYFENNPDNVSCTMLQKWVKDAVDGTTGDIRHRKKCITVNYVADYNIDMPVYLFDEENEEHPSLAIKDGDWREDDPKEMVQAFNDAKRAAPQLLRIVRYLKAWCDYKKEKMPSGLAMTVLAMSNIQTNQRDDVCLKYTLIEIENALKNKFECIVPATPNDNIFIDYDYTRRKNFMDNLSSFIADAKTAVDIEKNQLKASRLWKKHLGNRFPDGEDKDETVSANSIAPVIGASRPYYG